MGSEHYCLRWNNHQSNLLGVFSQLLRDESLVDVTLACSEGHSIRAHKVVLSACSSYFQTLFIDHPSRHPIVILKDVRFAELRTLIEFMYKGEVNVEYCQLSALLQTAESLKVKGLAEMTNLGPGNTSATTATSTNVLAPSVLKGDHPPPQLGEHSPEQTEPTELVSKKQTPPNVPPPPTITTTSTPILSNSGSTTSSCSTTLVTAPPSSLSLEEQQHPLLSHSGSSRASPLMGASNRVSTCRNHSPERSDSVETVRAIDSPTPIDEDDDDDDKCEPSDMTCGEKDRSLQQNNGSACPSTTTLCSRLPSPISSEPVPGPSNMPPVQQVPLSLKKEVDWGGGSADDKSIGESSSDYPRHCHDPSTDVERCFNSPTAHLDRPPSTHSSRSSTPFALPYPSLATSLLEVGLMHPALIGDEMFRCTACMAAFPSIWLLEQHTALQHIGSLNAAVNVAAVAAAAAAAAASGGSGGGGPGGPGCGGVDKPFVCEQCGQSYRYRSAYVKHREQNHRARLPADKLFSCDVCGMQFRYLKSFKKHRLNHALERLHGKTSSEASTETRPDCGLPSTTSRLDRDTQSQSHLENSSDQVSSSNETITVTEDTDTTATAVTLPSGQDLETAIPTLAIVKREVLDPADEPMATTTMDETPGCSSDTERVLSTDVEQDDTIDSFSLARISAAAALASASSSNNPLSLTQLPSGLEVSAGDLSAVYRNAQEASIINFLRADAAERQRERRFACPFCGKCVRSKENLKLHVRKHTGERPFVCLFCGRAFGGKSDLTRHLRIHTGERPYHCDMCGKCFARADYLSKHLTTHINTPR